MMNKKKKPIGLYVHVPFCDGKCPYCDFYSMRADESLKRKYTQQVKNVIQNFSPEIIHEVDTIYFGGGTPNLLGSADICSIVNLCAEKFQMNQPEITVEVNPTKDVRNFLREIHESGVNRLSIGLQSANNKELSAIGRRHTVEQAKRTIDDAAAAGFENISLDLMLAIPNQNTESLMKSIEFCHKVGAVHVSAYLLIIEDGTPFAEKKETLNLPNEEETAKRYVFTCEQLKKFGFHQYEISNFAKHGYESRHNLKYWHDEEYWGIGPGAHSFLNGNRFYYPRDLGEFLNGKSPCFDGKGGDFEEFALMAFRLTEGLCFNKCKSRFGTIGEKAFYNILEKSKPYKQAGMLQANEERIAFTTKGFLVSNELIAELLRN